MYPPYPSLLVWVRKILISIHNNSFATYIRQGKIPDGITCFVSWYGAVSDSTISSATYLLDVCRDHSGCDAFVCDHDGERCVNAPGGRHALYLSYRGYLGTKL